MPPNHRRRRKSNFKSKIVAQKFVNLAKMETNNLSWVIISACLYVLSGVSQPILMAYAKHAGLADPSCQLYMLFYYMGPAAVALTLRRPQKAKLPKREQNAPGQDYGSLSMGDVVVKEYGIAADERTWPSFSQIKFASFIALWDIGAQSMVYAGNNLAGPTIFSIIYSSVTVWAAIYSKFLLSRTMSRDQWIGVIFVVIGLAVTALDSLSQGDHIFAGAVLIFVGSSLHAMTYVLSEMIMAPSSTSYQSTEIEHILASDQSAKQFTKLRLEPISVRANCGIQGIVACLIFLFWQLFYTLPRFQSLIIAETTQAGTTLIQALVILSSLTVANLLHSVTFFQTLKDCPGGATSAGVLKGLQAVLVFLISSIVLCGRIGGKEMCWSHTKLLSLLVVVCGILFYGKSTSVKMEKETKWVLAKNGVNGVISA